MIVDTLKEKQPRWLKDIKYQALLKYRQSTSHMRALPDVLIVGAMCSGTTSLYCYFNQHPSLVPSYLREINFFDGGFISDRDNFYRGEGWYRSHFPMKRDMEALKTYEATTSYLHNPLAPERIYALIPDVKIIALVRNPTERAISHYFHSLRHDRETLPIMDALLSEEKRLKPIIESQNYTNEFFRNYSYKNRGLYFEQLSRYYNLFSRSNILSVDSTSLFEDPGNTLQRIYEFIGVDSEFTYSSLEHRHLGPNKTEVDSSVRDYLDTYFCTHNQAFFELIGETFNW